MVGLQFSLQTSQALPNPSASTTHGVAQSELVQSALQIAHDLIHIISSRIGQEYDCVCFSKSSSHAYLSPTSPRPLLSYPDPWNSQPLVAPCVPPAVLRRKVVHLYFPFSFSSGRPLTAAGDAKPGPLSKGIWKLEKYRHTVTTLKSQGFALIHPLEVPPFAVPIRM